MHYIHEKLKHMINQFRATTYVIRARKKKQKKTKQSHGCITNLRLSRPQIFSGLMNDYNRFT